MDTEKNHKPAVRPSRPRADRLAVLSEERIRERAHLIYLDRVASGAPGNANSDWLRAEAELRAEAVAAAAQTAAARPPSTRREPTPV